MACCGSCSGGSKSAFFPVMLAICSGAGTAIFVANKRHEEKKPVAILPIAAADEAPKAGDAKPEADPAYVLGFTMNRIDGTPQKLDEYKGKVIMMVNVASQCGLTKSQYPALEKLYASKKDAGFVILGFPANNFGSQEPGTNDEIHSFCTGTYGVEFPMFEKISVKGDDTHELYKRLAKQPAPLGGEPQWNFTKFIIDRSGKVVARFEPKVSPEAPEVVAKIDELLSAK